MHRVSLSLRHLEVMFKVPLGSRRTQDVRHRKRTSLWNAFLKSSLDMV